MIFYKYILDMFSRNKSNQLMMDSTTQFNNNNSTGSISSPSILRVSSAWNQHKSVSRIKSESNVCFVEDEAIKSDSPIIKRRNSENIQSRGRFQSPLRIDTSFALQTQYYTYPEMKGPYRDKHLCPDSPLQKPKLKKRTTIENDSIGLGLKPYFDQLVMHKENGEKTIIAVQSWNQVEDVLSTKNTDNLPNLHPQIISQHDT